MFPQFIDFYNFYIGAHGKFNSIFVWHTFHATNIEVIDLGEGAEGGITVNRHFVCGHFIYEAIFILT